MIKVAVRLPASPRDPGEFLADVRALEAAGADGIWFAPAGEGDWIVLGAVAALTHRIWIGVDGAQESPAAATLDRISGGRVLREPPVAERWSDVAMPPNRDAWSAELRRQEEAGSTGIVVQWDPRLIDLLRNPRDDDRSDLLMSTG